MCTEEEVSWIKAKNEELANYMYARVYDDNYRRFINGEYDCKFADAALRMGNCYRYGIGTPVNYRIAYEFYLQADLAIRLRSEYGHYGDSSVKCGIDRALAETRELYTYKSRKVSWSHPDFLQDILVDGHRAKARIKALKNSTYSIEFTPLKEPFCPEPNILVIVAGADYCELVKSYKVKTGKGADVEVKGNKDEIVFNNFTYDWDTGVLVLLMDDEVMASIKTQKYVFQVPGKAEI